MKTAMQGFWNKIALKLSVEQINEFLPEFYNGLEKEKQQIQKSYKDHHDLGHIYGLDTEQYYNENYK